MSKALDMARVMRAEGKSAAWIAREIGVSDSHIRRWMLGHYGEHAAALETAFLRRFERRICPHDGEEKTPQHCQRVALRPRPHGFPDAETLWLCCQSCPHKPVSGGAK